MPKISYLLLEKKRYLWFYPKAQIFVIEKYKNQIIYIKYPQPIESKIIQALYHA